jgi:hypothetical protein
MKLTMYSNCLYCSVILSPDVVTTANIFVRQACWYYYNSKTYGINASDQHVNINDVH